MTTAYQVEQLPLPQMSPLTRRELQVLHFGRPGARPKAYLQASLHADETPPLLVANHLAERLRRAALADAVRGHVVLVPVANPVGLSQAVGGRLLGRFALDGTGNFNRHYPDLFALVGDELEGRLGGDAQSNVVAVRETLSAALSEVPRRDELDELRTTLLGLALDADIAIDLHCDEHALVHLFLGTPLWPAGRDLAAWLGSRATLLAHESGGNPFDEAVGGPWWRLAERFPDRPLPPGCLAATLELRGERDVDEALAAADADALYRFLQGRGLLAGEPGEPPPLAAEATGLDAVELVRAPHPGVCCLHREPGVQVHRGDLLCTLVDPAERDFRAARTELRAGTDGLLFATRLQRMARRGDVLCKVAGREPLADRARGPLLTSR